MQIKISSEKQTNKQTNKPYNYESLWEFIELLDLSLSPVAVSMDQAINSMWKVDIALVARVGI